MARSHGLAQTRTQVLVVGAGAVGLMAALRLRQHGVDVRIIDQQPERRAHSFPVVLHPQSLRLLTQAGLSSALLWCGQELTGLAVYTENERRLVLRLPRVTEDASGTLTLPQDTLRQALLGALQAQGVEVEWNTRLGVLQQDARSIWGRLVREDAARLLQKSTQVEVDSFQADFVIGADGYDSTTRQALGIDLVDHGPLQTFAFFDVPAQRAGREAQLALSDEYHSSVYPLHGGQARFSFQLGRTLNKAPDAAALSELLLTRMPWQQIDDSAPSCSWSGIAEFRHALVSRFGDNRAWLVGEAAHLIGPLGGQSLNIGLDEASELALRISEALRQPSSAPFGPHYDARRQRQWRMLLGLEEHVALSERSPVWVGRHARRILACLPASNGDLDELLEQLRVLPIPRAHSD